ncbi:MAG: hypothetical protein WD063_01145 [Pirellulales bacterium]
MAGDSSRNAEGFESTRWSLVALVRSDDSQVRRRALERLLSTYYPALRSHLVIRMGLAHSRAEDVLQSFVVQKILERDLLAQADREKGRLRSLLLKSLENFARTEIVRDRRHDWQQSLDDDSKNEALRADAPAADVFDVAWARSVLVEALLRMWKDCRKMGRKHVWALLQARVIDPAMGRPIVPYDELIERLGLHTPEEASNALVTAKRQFQRTLRAVVAESVDSEDEIDKELGELGEILAGAPPGSSGGFFREASFATDEETDPILSAIDDSNPRVLARLMELPTDCDSLWDDADLPSLVRHQLRVPLNLVFAKLAGEGGRSSLLLPSFGAMLTSPAGSVQVLDSVRRAARAAISDDTAGIPRQMAALFYFASIALALVKHSTRISKSDDDVLRYGFQKMLDQPWLGKRLTQLFTKGLERLKAAKEGAG